MSGNSSPAAVLTVKDAKALIAILDRVSGDQMRYGELSDAAGTLRSKLSLSALLLGAMLGQPVLIQIVKA
jgi:hypothetical protein